MTHIDENSGKIFSPLGARGQKFAKSLARVEFQTLTGLTNLRHTKNGQCFAHDCIKIFRMKLFAVFGCFKEKFNSAIVEEGKMIPTNFIATIVAANRNAMVGLDKNNQERVHTKQIILQYFNLKTLNV